MYVISPSVHFKQKKTGSSSSVPWLSTESMGRDGSLLLVNVFCWKTKMRIPFLCFVEATHSLFCDLHITVALPMQKLKT